ncbi:MAG: SDR family NAD(P)-dependent oxidoreductase [Candidatus Dormibacter sp.]
MDRSRKGEMQITSTKGPADRPLALVTGASSGIGRAYARRLAADGHDLCVVARRADRLEELKRQLEAEHGVSVSVLPADLSTESGRHEVDAAAADPRLALLVDCAALAYYMPFLSLPPDTAEELVNLNVLAPVRLIRAALPGMVERGRGALVCFSSLMAFSSTSENPLLPKRAVYTAGKAFLLTFIRLLAIELRDTGVRVQVVCPAIVKSEFQSRQNIDVSNRPRMEPEVVVSASLIGLELGEVVCMPTVEDADLLQRYDLAESEILAAGLRPPLAKRYIR